MLIPLSPQAMQPQAQRPALPQQDLMSTLTEAELAQLLGLGSLDEKNEMLAQQMAQAEALRNSARSPHSTGLGAALGGLGTVLRQVGGMTQGDSTRKQQEDVRRQKDESRRLFVEAMRRQAQGPNGMAGAAGIGGMALPTKPNPYGF